MQTEAEKYNDMVMFDFLDTYRNLTIKSLVTMDWAYNNINAAYYFKIDDDVFVKLKAIFQIIKENVHEEKILMGRCIFKDRPKRSPSNQYYVSTKMYAGEYYPPFCYGGYIISRKSLEVILPLSDITPLITLEDVSMGILLKAAGNISMISITGWRGDYYTRAHCPSNPTYHPLTAQNIKTSWRLCKEKLEV